MAGVDGNMILLDSSSAFEVDTLVTILARVRCISHINMKHIIQKMHAQIRHPMKGYELPGRKGSHFCWRSGWKLYLLSHCV